jgi:hypothetical protein
MQRSVKSEAERLYFFVEKSIDIYELVIYYINMVYELVNQIYLEEEDTNVNNSKRGKKNK